MLLADSALPHPFEVMAMKAMTVVVLFLLLLAPPAVSQVPDDKLIVPGQRIGKWTLEMTIDTVLQMNGPRNIPRGIPGTPLDRMRAYFADSNDEIWWHWWAASGSQQPPGGEMYSALSTSLQIMVTSRQTRA